jgi:hypothetical protein
MTLWLLGGTLDGLQIAGTFGERGRAALPPLTLGEHPRGAKLGTWRAPQGSGDKLSPVRAPVPDRA